MLAQVMRFRGPRSDEMIAASDRASTERLGPTMMANPTVQEEFVALLSLRQPDGGEMRILVMRSQRGFDVVRELVMSSQLLPCEDVALLPGPDAIERYTVTDLIGSLEPAMTSGKAHSATG